VSGTFTAENYASRVLTLLSAEHNCPVRAAPPRDRISIIAVATSRVFADCARFCNPILHGHSCPGYRTDELQDREHNVSRGFDSDRMTSRGESSSSLPLFVIVSSLPALPRCCLRDAESPTPATQAKMLPSTKSCLHGILVLRSSRAITYIGEFIQVDLTPGLPKSCRKTCTMTLGFLPVTSTITSSQPLA
jgi:hypothetical protein